MSLTGILKLDGHEVLFFEDIVGQNVTEIAPAVKLLAKWKFSGLDVNEVTSKRPITNNLAILSVSMKSSNALNQISVFNEGSVDDITYASTVPLTSVSTTQITNFHGKETRAGVSIFANQVGQANFFLRLVAQNNTATHNGDYKSLKYTMLLTLPSGCKVEKVF